MPVSVRSKAFNRDFSVSDLFPRSQRCGIYVLRFLNGDHYIGQSVDVVARFAQHRAEKDDIQSLSFLHTTPELLDKAERDAIRLAEQASCHLRNIQLVSIVLGETDLDLLVPRQMQMEWLQDDEFYERPSPRPNDTDVRRRHEKKAPKLFMSKHADDIRSILEAYVKRCLPFACKTEFSFWTISCFPGSSSCLFRVNVNWQEVFTAWPAGEDDIEFAFQLRRTKFFEGMHSLEPLPAQMLLLDNRYDAGGADQVRVQTFSPVEVSSLLDTAWFRRSIKEFNLNLMRKGGNPYASSHCFSLVDAVWKDEEDPASIVGKSESMDLISE